jgi:hypothetical protein
MFIYSLWAQRPIYGRAERGQQQFACDDTLCLGLHYHFILLKQSQIGKT